MPYIGNDLATQFQAFATQTITGDGSTSYTLDRAVANGKELLVYINNVKQEEGSGESYEASGTTITFSEAVASGDSCYLVYMGSAQQTVTAPNGSIVSGQIANANLEMPNTLDMNGKELILDADADTSITADTDDQVDIKVGGSDKVTVTTTGLGVGTTAPPVPLTSSISSNGGNILAYRNSESDGDYGGVEFHNHPSSLTGYRKGAIYFQSDGNGFGRGAMSFCVDGDGDANNVGIADERMRIDSSGRILIAKNTTSTSTDGLEIRTTGSDAGRINHASPSELFYFYDSSDGGQVGYIAHNGSNVTYSTSSDYRLKENIVTDWDATTRLKQLKPTRFSWKKESKTQADTDGFLAHEVSSIVPQAIKGEKDAVDADGNPEYQGIDHSTLVPLLTKALQESIARADALEARIKKLEDG